MMPARKPPRIEHNERIHVALVGFMGAGKTTVGKVVAEKYGAPFVDLDELICSRAGKTIQELFRDHGEVGFRAHERAALRELLESKKPLVIALGGGTFVDSAMRSWVQRVAKTVYLKVSPEQLSERLLQADQRRRRPLLAGPDAAQTIKRLLSERTPAYEQCDVTVLAEDVAPAQVAESVVSALRHERGRPKARLESLPRQLPLVAPLASAHSQKSLPEPDVAAAESPVSESTLLRATSSLGSYPVEIRPEGGAWIAEAIVATCPGDIIAVITDDVVHDLHIEQLTDGLARAGKEVSVHIVPAGDASKTLATAGRLYEELAAARLSRRDAIVGVGGGMITDLAGFVASTYMRGLPVVHVPTSTLGVVDASVGGKTGLNTPHGKNLVGTFYPPKAVLVAVELLRTQPRRTHAAGLAEALKIAATCDAVLFGEIVRSAQSLLAFDGAALARVLRRAVELKAAIVARDERETGERMVLNFGHTVGHAIEKAHDYACLHGEAVALGMLAEVAFAEQHGLGSAVRQRLQEGLVALELPTDWRHSRLDPEAVRLDKKHAGSRVTVPVVTRIGASKLESIGLDELVAFLQKECR